MRRLTPVHTIALGYTVLNLVGALGLWLAATGKVSYFDALFTATSALTVTGLVVVPTATSFSFAGHLWLLLLIQIGGMGWLTLGLGIAARMGRRLGTIELKHFVEERGGSIGNVLKLSLLVFRVVGVVEAVGAVLLAFFFWRHEVPLGRAIWWGIFHSVSAFNNAGFDLTGSSMVPFADSPGILLTIGLLIVIGGLGFSVVGELVGIRKERKLSIHAVTVLKMSGGLILAGTLVFYVLDHGGALQHLPEGQRWLSALFSSIAARTAGFNSVDSAAWSNGSLLFAVLLMFIGASPLSTGGGVKTTTVAVALATMRSYARGIREVRLRTNQVPEDLVRKSFVLLTGAALLLMLAIVVLMAAEPAIPPLHLVYEAASAFGTVGVSAGVTSKLGVIGRIVIMGLMMCGKIGVMSVLSLSLSRVESRLKYPQADSLIVG